eukprot:1623486-Pyramimonas_sp.AAC.1
MMASSHRGPLSAPWAGRCLGISMGIQYRASFIYNIFVRLTPRWSSLPVSLVVNRQVCCIWISAQASPSCPLLDLESARGKPSSCLRFARGLAALPGNVHRLAPG